MIDLGDAGTFALIADADDRAMRAMLARLDPSPPHASRRLAAICRARLEGLPPPAEADAATMNTRNAAAIRESERRVLRWWVQYAGQDA